jgi:alpha-tubulin suppressor-like RCC1 family protein
MESQALRPLWSLKRFRQESRTPLELTPILTALVFLEPHDITRRNMKFPQNSSCSAFSPSLLKKISSTLALFSVAFALTACPGPSGMPGIEDGGSLPDASADGSPDARGSDAGSDSSPDVRPDVGVSCSAGFANCDGVASNGCEVNLNTSDSHCGACGRSCPASQTCSSGACVDRCPIGLSFCGGNCIDTQTSNAHCGACGNVCGEGQFCRAGACRTANLSTVASGNDHVCALGSGGTVFCWGLNTWGQLGVGTTTTSAVPRQVLGISNAVEVGTSGGSSFARLADGTVVGWGLHFGLGELGDGSRDTQQPSPVPVLGLNGTVDISTGGFAHSCAVRFDGTIRCWGYNAYGQLGDGTTANRVAPGLVVGITRAVEVSAGYLHSCARLEDGTVQCWGYNAYGQLGNGTTDNSLSPVTVIGISNAVELASGTSHTCARLQDGSVQCWGYNAYGQLGDGTTTNRVAPGLVVGLADAAEISTGNDVFRGNQNGSAADRTCARRANGTVVCWGYNGYGGIGDGTTTNRLLPTPVLGLTNVIDLDASGRYHTCARRADRSIFCWGYGGNGQMGDATFSSRSAPGLVIGFP